MAKLRIGVDVDCGSHVGSRDASSRIREGILGFVKKNKDVEVVPYGFEKNVGELCDIGHPGIASPVYSTTQGGSNLRRVPGASLNSLVRDVDRGNLDGMVSIGATERVIVEASKLGRYKVNGEKVPFSLVVQLPSANGRYLLTDVGAGRGLFSTDGENIPFNKAVEKVAKGVYVKGLMTIGYARSCLSNECPRVGVLCNGTESNKGNALIPAIDSLFSANDSRSFDYVGRVEPGSSIDIMVTDGFTGNICLKEKGADLEMIRKRIDGVVSSFPFIGPGVYRAGERMYEFLSDLRGDSLGGKVGGAILLGNERGVVVKGHGVSSAKKVSNSIAEAARYAQDKSSDEIRRVLEEGLSF